MYKTVLSADKNESFNNEGSTGFQTPLVSALPNSVIPNCANVDEVIFSIYFSQMYELSGSLFRRP